MNTLKVAVKLDDALEEMRKGMETDNPAMHVLLGRWMEEVSKVSNELKAIRAFDSSEESTCRPT